MKNKSIYNKIVGFEVDNVSFNLAVFPIKIKRRIDLRGDKYGVYSNDYVFDLRIRYIEKEKNYGYISISFCYFFRINIDLHRPI